MALHGKATKVFKITNMKYHLTFQNKVGYILNIEEFGLNYDETVDFDLETFDVIDHGPSHERDGKVFQDTTQITNTALVRLIILTTVFSKEFLFRA